ncbi:Linear gramicidin synthase subunit D [Cercospora beticola]|uniref:Linear gramicidin synthase subunit D n=1 Tax=Cercospora beticola TaxID=122368 RepID=A0A2G5I5S3_CERBT|nr:Linear gramicidin synthase subunit D [Cercospora beticola]PIB00155.1 Linear gramicidin synthase subunit D [Cercospora beticola]WPB00636.1 hypothetical protein RHO25_005256 [Cercospora beticola]CAK1361138.1 unnamed protein product [Cercospora beticola]
MSSTSSEGLAPGGSWSDVTGASTPRTFSGASSVTSFFSVDDRSTLGKVEGLAIYPHVTPASPRTLVQVLDATISAHPEALAIDNGTSSLTYAALRKEIRTKAAQLREAGVSVGDRVGIRLSSGTIELYVGILSVLSVGAAYCPVNEDDPKERIDLVWTEADVVAVLTDEGVVVRRQSKRSPSEAGPTTEDDAWIIFTSGSTGKPKGVAVTHRSAAAFVDAEADLFLQQKPLGPGDRVLAGLSIAFDASCEEMWLAWRYGACLVPAPRSVVKAGPELGAFLIAQSISVVSTVPTLVAMWPSRALENIRLLILGGEALPPELADRLACSVSGEVWNTYGPTEATVVSCAAQVKPKQPVAIGLPLVGWKLAVIGPNGRAVRWGEEGELVIGGIGMARYLDSEKDKAKFTPLEEFSGERAYRSGDLVRAEKEGLFFVGRNDEQIKFGGRRIELGEIDAALLMLEGVSAAACTIQRSEMGSQVLVGYVVRSHGDPAADREKLRNMLPPSQVPMIATVDHIPIRPSGKVDRKALPWPLPTSLMSDDQQLDGTIGYVGEQWRRVLGVKPAPDSNFFDLGGSSLGAAQLVSQLRAKVPSLSVADVYEHSSLCDMAARVDELSSAHQEQREVVPTPRWTFVVQLPLLFIEFLLEGLRLLAIMFLTKKAFSVRLQPTSWAARHDIPWWLVAVVWFLMISMPGRVIVFTSIVRVLTLRIARGTYKRGSWTHIRLWAAERFVDTGRLGGVSGTIWARVYARLLGNKMEGHVQLHTLPPVTGLGTFGRGCAIEPEADIAGWWLDGDLLHIGEVRIGEGARVGTRSLLMPDTTLEPYATVEPGICAKDVIKGPDAIFPIHPQVANEPSFGRRIWTMVRDTLSLLILDLLPVLTVAPVWGMAAALTPDYNNLMSLFDAVLKMMVPGIVLGTFLYAVITITLVRLASLAIKPGRHSWHSRTAWAAWLTRGVMLDARSTLFPIYSSLLTPAWLRLAGAKIGRNVEISTVVPIPKLLQVADDAFLADDVLVSPYELGVGYVQLGVTSIGEKSFVGNTGLVKAGTSIPGKVLIGVHATAPPEAQMVPNSTWLGRPPISLPRQAEEPASSKRTFNPPRRLKLARALVESGRIVPMLILGALSTAVFLGMLWFLDRFGVGWAILVSPGLVIGAALAACTITTAAKWLLTPNVHAGQQSPLWSHFVWRNELADTFVQSLALPYIRPCFGTPLLSLWLCTMGAKIGRGAWLESHLLPETELCVVGAGATVNRQCVLQTHLFHDRLMRMDKVCLQAGATLGPNAIALLGTDIAAGVTVGPKSLVMRGEHLPAGTDWLGNPVRPWSRTVPKRKAGGSISETSSASLDEKEKLDV